MATSFAKGVNPFTGESDIKTVSIPAHASYARGTTRYDEHFEKLLPCNVAIEVPGELFQAIRKASTRFFEYRGIKETYRVRQRKMPNGRYTLWFVEEAPRKNNQRAKK